ncbi:hypothetical protein DL765_003923 [Monosporascus sp. GIB2]|nr:hypothetical protein DL765_003923 [Monosporascus sp. GIB2]
MRSNRYFTVKQHIRACNVWANDFRNSAGSDVAPSSTETKTEDAVPQLGWTAAASEHETGGRVVTQSVEHLQSYLENRRWAKNRTMLFATVSDTTVGVYVGADLLNPSVAKNFFGPFLGMLYSVGIADSTAALIQVCEGRTGDQILGLIAAASANFATVHNAVRQWSNGTCVDTSSYAETLQHNSTTIATIKPTIAPTPVRSNTTVSTAPSASNSTVRRILQARADCRAIDVKSGNGCGDLVSRCGGGLTARTFTSTTRPPTCAQLFRLVSASAVLAQPQPPNGVLLAIKHNSGLDRN